MLTLLHRSSPFVSRASAPPFFSFSPTSREKGVMGSPSGERKRPWTYCLLPSAYIFHRSAAVCTGSSHSSSISSSSMVTVIEQPAMSSEVT